MAFLSTISTYLSKRKSDPAILNEREIKRLRQGDSNSESNTTINTTDGSNMILDKIIEDTQLELSSINHSSSSKYQNSMNKLIMSYVQNSSSIDVVDSIPRANLIRNIYSTKLIENINQDKNCNREERLLWNMMNLIFEDNKSTTVNDDHHSTEKRDKDIIKPSSQHILELKKWIQNIVFEETKLIYQQEHGMMDELNEHDKEDKEDIIEMMMKKKNDNDPWQLALYYMSTGQIFKTCELLLKLGDNALSTLISLHHQGYDIRESVMEQLKLWKDQEILETLPIHQQKMWFILQGDLGYVNQLKTVVVQDLYWPQVLFLYMNYFDRYGNIFSGLTQYHYITHDHHQHQHDKVVGIHQLKTKNQTASPSPLTNYWYYLLIWWLSSDSSLSFTSFNTFLYHETIHRKQLEFYLPLRFRWLLSLHAPTLFKNESKEIELWKDQWCDLLYQDKWEYLAIHASLFITNSHNTIYRLLSLREWEKEFYLIEQLKIPKQWIMDAKITYAFNHRMYTKEIHYYLESGEIDKVYNAIINHLIPVSFFKADQSDTTKLYLSKLSELYPNDNNIQQTIKYLLDIQRILFTFPNILKMATVNHDQSEEMKNELRLVFPHLKHLKEVFGSSIKPDFCSKIAGKLLIVVSLFRDHELFNHLLETCPIEYHCDSDMIKVISKSMVYSFNN
ncbi:unnamed protein product [Cunninghamella blakesleeana]